MIPSSMKNGHLKGTVWNGEIAPVDRCFEALPNVWTLWDAPKMRAQDMGPRRLCYKVQYRSLQWSATRFATLLLPCLWKIHLHKMSIFWEPKWSVISGDVCKSNTNIFVQFVVYTDLYNFSSQRSNLMSIINQIEK